MFIRRKTFEAVKLENKNLKRALEIITDRYNRRGLRLVELENQVNRRDPKTGKFVKK